MNISDLKPCEICAIEGYPYDEKTCQTCPNAPVKNVEKESEPMKRTWKDKLTSRKFWAAVVGVVISVMVLFGATTEEQDKTTALITACGTLVAYIVGEGMTDAVHKKNEGEVDDSKREG